MIQIKAKLTFLIACDEAALRDLQRALIRNGAPAVVRRDGERAWMQEIERHLGPLEDARASG